MKEKLNIGVVGATGMVGQAFLKLLEERSFPLGNVKLFASQQSIGKKISFMSKVYEVEAPQRNAFRGLDIVFFSSGDDISREWAPIAVSEGAFAIDNSGAFRMSPEHALVVPEVNGNLLEKMKAPQVIANPNCSTIQLVVALQPLAREFGISEVRVSSYQAVSGAGLGGYQELLAQTKNYEDPQPQYKEFVHPILFNAIPQIGSFDPSGFCTEELKIMKETRKIMSLPELKISAFTVRVPILNAHSEAVWVTLKTKVEREQILATLKSGPGLSIIDDPAQSQYPMPREVSGKDDVYVGRIHRDLEDPHLWLLWVVSDNLKKGAALNGIQIAEQLCRSYSFAN